VNSVAIWTVVFAVFCLAGFFVWIGEMIAALFSNGDAHVVMERPEFADTQPERERAVIAAAELVLVRVPPYLDVEDEDRTDVISRWAQMEPTEAMERWVKPTTTYTSHNGWKDDES
jgi:hypothetical protein